MGSLRSLRRKDYPYEILCEAYRGVSKALVKIGFVYSEMDRDWLSVGEFPYQYYEFTADDPLMGNTLVIRFYPGTLFQDEHFEASLAEDFEYFQSFKVLDSLIPGLVEQIQNQIYDRCTCKPSHDPQTECPNCGGQLLLRRDIQGAR